MPILGSSVNSAGLVKPGVFLPAGWNTNWKAARDNSANALAEVCIVGDSTTYGSCTTLGFPVYSWITRLRQLSVAGGFQDGGPGILYDDSSDTNNYDGITYTVAKTGFAYSGGAFLVTADTAQSVTPGDSITFRGKGTKLRLHYTKQQNCGSFSYAIDGGAPTTVNANTGGGVFTADSVIVTGLSDAVHTVTVVNLGGGSGDLAAFNAEFVRSTGIVYHKNAIVGAAYGSLANPSIGAFGLQLMLGLTPGVPGAFDWQSSQKQGGQYRNVSLAISALGVNNLQGASVAGQGNPTNTEIDAAVRTCETMRNSVLHFIRLARAVGADPLIIVPHFDLALNTHTFGGMFEAAVWDTAVAAGAACVSFNQAIRPINTMVARGLGAPGVHAEKGAYDAEAEFLWAQALSL